MPALGRPGEYRTPSASVLTPSGHASIGRGRRRDPSLMAAPEVSVVIVACNRPVELRRALKSTFAQTGAACEVFVFDNSTDGRVAELVSGEFPETTYLKASSNTGPCVARNLCAEQAAGEVLVFLDDDAFFTDDTTLMKVADTMRASGGVGGLGMTFVEPFNPRNKLERPLAGRVPPGGLRSFVACAAAVRKSAFREVGGFHTAVLIDGEERDLCVRLRLKGYRIGYVAVGPVVHSRSPVRDPGTRVVHAITNQVLFDYWYLPGPLVVPSILRHAWKLLAYRFTWESIPMKLTGIVRGIAECRRHRDLRMPMTYAHWRSYMSLPTHGAEPISVDEAVWEDQPE